jgi:ribonuclease PH
MNIKVNINFPAYYEENYDNMKNSLETKMEDLFFHNILTERYQKTKLEINIDILEFECEVTHYAIMAATLALTLANIEQKGILTACNLVCSEDGNILVDPTVEEERLVGYKLVFGSIIELQENNLYIQSGRLDDVNHKNVEKFLF